MKNRLTKSMALILSAVLVLGSTLGITAFGMNSAETEKSDKKDISIIENKEESDVQKDETVYVLASADGGVRKIIVSDWIKNSVGKDTLNDKSELTDVENVKGDETYKMNGDNMRVWDAEGNDIYYQGNIEKELPVYLSVSYKLDGESISAEELAGKSGKVTIRFQYKNNQYETVKIDGKNEKIYVPFAMITGMMLDNDVFRNVDVSNGKLINDGSRSIVAGIALPGLQENLNVEKDKFEIPDYIEVTADVEKFEMTNTVTIAANDIFSKINTKSFDSVEDLTKSLNQLSTAMNKLLDGSSKLYSGLCTLLDKSDELVSGIEKLSAGAEKLKNGSKKLNSGANDLNKGTKDLSSGLGQLTANNKKLNAGSKQVFETLLQTANTQLAANGLTVDKLTIDNYAKVLNNVIDSLDKDKVAQKARAVAKEKVTEKVNENRQTVKDGVTAAVKQTITDNVTKGVRKGQKANAINAVLHMTEAEYNEGVQNGTITEAQQAQVESALDGIMQNETIVSQISIAVNQEMQKDSTKALIESETNKKVEQLIEQNMNSEEVQAEITAALQKAQSGAVAVSKLKEQLDSYNEFYTGLYEYTAGVASAKAGADKLYAGTKTLKSGTGELYQGMNELYNGILTLKNGAPALVGGVSKLRDGSMKLSNGLKEFNKKGVKKLVDAVDGDIGGLVTRAKATVDVSKDYKSFSGISDDMDGNVKFVYRTDSIKAEKSK